MWQSILAICIGACGGAVLRWVLGSKLNPLLPGLPPGTLLVNLVGGYLIGVAIAWFGSHPHVAPAWRLLLITGFLGSLTTFSAFSAEVIGLLQDGRAGWALITIAAHLFGSLLMTALGIGTVTLFCR